MSVYQIEFDTDAQRKQCSSGAKSRYTPADFEPCNLSDALIPTAIRFSELMSRGKQYKGRNRKIILAVAAWQAHNVHNMNSQLSFFLISYDLNPNCFHSLMKKVSPVQTGIPILQNEPDLVFNLRRILDQLIGPLKLSSQIQTEILSLGIKVQKHELTQKLRPTAAALVVAIYFLTHRSLCTHSRAMEILSEFTISDPLFQKIHDLVDQIYNQD